MRSCLLVLCLITDIVTANFFSPYNSSVYFWQGAVTVNNTLYFAGGERWLLNSAKTSHSPNFLHQTNSIDLSSSWTNLTVATTTVAYPEDLPAVRQPILFHNPITDQVDYYGGWPYADYDFDSSLWTFSAGTNGDSMSWTMADNAPTTNQDSGDSLAPFAAAYAQSDKELFVFGGHVVIGSSTDMMLPGLVRYDFSAQTWSNNTVDIPDSTGLITGAQAAFAPIFGSEGYLIVVGGRTGNSLRLNLEESDADTTYNSMATIMLYDVASSKWYTQRATGDIPPPRREFCSVASVSRDNTTFEMYIYGGATNDTNDLNTGTSEGYTSVYVLSLPAFRWFQATPAGGPRRSAHKCAIVAQSQMISIGGRLPATRSNFGQQTDPWRGIGIFSLNDLTWSDHYDSVAPEYRRPRLVNRYYTSSYTEPRWSDTSLASIFAYNGTGSNSTSNNSGNNATNNNPSSGGGSNTGAIAGGVVGGVVVLGLIVGAIFYFRRKKKRQAAAPAYQEPYGYGPEKHTGANGATELASIPMYEAGAIPVHPSEPPSLPPVKTGGPDGSHRAELP